MTDAFSVFWASRLIPPAQQTRAELYRQIYLPATEYPCPCSYCTFAQPRVILFDFFLVTKYSKIQVSNFTYSALSTCTRQRNRFVYVDVQRCCRTRRGQILVLLLCNISPTVRSPCRCAISACKQSISGTIFVRSARV